MKIPGGKTRSTLKLSAIDREARKAKQEDSTITRFELESQGCVMRRLASAHSHRGRGGHPLAGAR
jgi:hypothetical protein